MSVVIHSVPIVNSLAATVQACRGMHAPQIRVQVASSTAMCVTSLCKVSNPPPVLFHTWLERFKYSRKPRSFKKAVSPDQNWLCKSSLRATCWLVEGYKQANRRDAYGSLTLDFGSFQRDVLSSYFPSSSEQERLKRERTGEELSFGVFISSNPRPCHVLQFTDSAQVFADAARYLEFLRGLRVETDISRSLSDSFGGIWWLDAAKEHAGSAIPPIYQLGFPAVWVPFCRGYTHHVCHHIVDVRHLEECRFRVLTRSLDAIRAVSLPLTQDQEPILQVTITGALFIFECMIISALKARTLLSHGCEGFLATIHDTTSDVSSIHDQPIVSEFQDIFPEAIPGILYSCGVKERTFPKIAFAHVYGLFILEFFGYPFGLTNCSSLTRESSPASVYLILRQENLYASFPSAEFWLVRWHFVHIVSADGIPMDPAKVRSLMNEEREKSFEELRTFGFSLFYSSSGFRWDFRFTVMLLRRGLGSDSQKDDGEYGHYSEYWSTDEFALMAGWHLLAGVDEDVSRSQATLLVEWYEARCGYVGVKVLIIVSRLRLNTNGSGYCNMIEIPVWESWGEISWILVTGLPELRGSTLLSGLLWLQVSSSSRLSLIHSIRCAGVILQEDPGLFYTVRTGSHETRTIHFVKIRLEESSSTLGRLLGDRESIRTSYSHFLP
ncbi:hypothetical protein Tco_1043772 [Tanacetum coccineum]|uniref:Uncharacterized protein n=1 Tax=Tanacetum coccineum TaxID=301880 RepID=A0ABQ5GQ55_9ASTR